MDIEDLRNPHLHRQGIVHETMRIKAHIEELFECFPGYNPKKTIERWTRRLADAGYRDTEVKAGVDCCVATLSKVPAISEFETIIRNQSPRIDHKHLAREREVHDQAERLREWTAKCEAEFLEVFTQDQLIQSVRAWWTGVYGGDPSEYGMGLRVFLPIFFQDLMAGNRNLDKAIEIGRTRSRQP